MTQRALVITTMVVAVVLASTMMAKPVYANYNDAYADNLDYFHHPNRELGELIVEHTQHSENTLLQTASHQPGQPQHP